MTLFLVARRIGGSHAERSHDRQQGNNLTQRRESIASGRRPPERRRSFVSRKEGSIEPLRVLQNALLVAFVVTVVVTDWRWQRIPNVVTYPAMLVGVALGILEGFPGEPFRSGLLDHVAGLVAAFLVSYPLTVPGWMKPGDAKLLMAVGALRGGWFFVYAGMYGAILGGLLAIVLIVGRRLIPPETAQPNPFWHLMRSSIPYGVALGLGALLALGRELAA